MLNLNENNIVLGECLDVLKELPDGSIDLCYVDPPFGTGKKQTKTTLRTVQNDKGSRNGFGDRRYDEIKLGSISFQDQFSDYCAWIEPYLLEVHRVIAKQGSFLLHLDYREVHYCKVLLDYIFGRDCFQNEIIWSYDFGGRSKTRWSCKHDTILWYSKDPKYYTFNYDEIDRIPYLAPGLVGAEKAARGKTPTDVHWSTIVPTQGKEKTGYPTQKPLGLIRRFVRVHSNPGDHLLDFMCGSGTFGEAAALFGRKFTLVDSSPEAITIAKKRLAAHTPNLINN